MTGIEAVSLLIGTVVGFGWLPMRIAVRLRPNGTVARSMQKHAVTEKVAAGISTAFVVLVALVFGSEIFASEQIGAKQLLIPAMIGPVVWLVVAIVFGESVQSIEPLKMPAHSKIGGQDIIDGEEVGRCFVIDGNNIARLDGGELDLAAVRSLACFLLSRGDNVRVYFDANIGMLISGGKNHLGSADLAEMLGISEGVVSIVPGGSLADEWILLFADEHGAVVLSNDRFRDFEDKYPFIAEKDRLLKVMREGDRLRIQGFSKSMLIA